MRIHSNFTMKGVVRKGEAELLASESGALCHPSFDDLHFQSFACLVDSLKPAFLEVSEHIFSETLILATEHVLCYFYANFLIIDPSSCSPDIPRPLESFQTTTKSSRIETDADDEVCDT